MADQLYAKETARKRTCSKDIKPLFLIMVTELLCLWAYNKSIAAPSIPNSNHLLQIMSNVCLNEGPRGPGGKHEQKAGKREDSYRHADYSR
jgi:hypothetical protein